MGDTADPFIKILPVEVPEDDPFRYDTLGRKEFCETLTLRIQKSTTPFVLAIDTEWGSGKTTFLKMWRAHLTNNGFQTVLFNAWRCDFYNEALPALIGEIEKQIKPEPSLRKTARKLVGSFQPAVTTITTSILSGAIVTAIAAATSKDIPSLPPYLPIVLWTAAATLVALALRQALQKHDKIQNYLDYQGVVKEFRQALRGVANEQTQKPLVIFIDELDRCRPTFALDVLEKVKHIFNIRSVFFVIAVNKKGLAKTIRSEYGDIDGQIYLQKFFDGTTSLKNDNRGFAKKLSQKVKIDLSLQIQKNLSEVFSDLCDIFAPSLRAQEQIISLLFTALSSVAQQKIPHIIGDEEDEDEEWLKRWLCAFVFFTMLKAINPILFREAANSLNRKVLAQKSFPSEKIESFLDERINISQEDGAEGPKYLPPSITLIKELLRRLNEEQNEDNIQIGAAAAISIAVVMSKKNLREMVAELLDIIDLVE